MTSQNVGGYAFLIALVIAVFAGIATTFMSAAIAGVASIVVLVLVLLGLVVGLMNIHDKNITDFLVATIAIIMVGSSAGGLAVLDAFIPGFKLGALLVTIVTNIVLVAGAAALVVGLKQILNLATAGKK
ncbi:MAG: hypothetical protein AABW59_04630 [archaeon]